MTYTPGDFYRICDRCGRKKLASLTRKEWTGLIVCQEHWEARHPQEFVRGRRDEQRVPEPRPRSADLLLGPLQTTTSAAASAGSVTLVLADTARMADGDHIRVALANGTFCQLVIQSVVDASQIIITTPLPDSVASGAVVVDTSAVSVADIG